MGNRDSRIELLRFFATICIAIFHFEWIYIGNPVYFRHFYIWVEFFFVLSGFFLARNIDRANDDLFASFFYVIRQAKKMWPPYIIAFLFSFVVFCIANKISDVCSILNVLWKSKWEMVYFQLSGFELAAPVINGVTAYIPALLGASLVVHYCLQNHYKITINILAPMLPVFIYSHIINTYGNLSQWMPYENWYTVGLLRALAGMLLGVLAYEVGYKTKNVWVDIKLLIALACILAIACLVIFCQHIDFYDEICYPYIFAVLVATIYFSPSKKIPQKVESFLLYLGKISYCIYLLHYGVCHLLKIYIPGQSYSMCAPLYLIGVCTLGAICSACLEDLLSAKQ